MNKFLNKKSKIVVIKIGSNAVYSSKKDGINTSLLKALSALCKNLQDQKLFPIIVSSGAIALGKKVIYPSKKHLTLAQKQAAASVGQTQLINAYENEFKKKKINCSQVLLTAITFKHKNRKENFLNCLNALFRAKVVPIINENDSVSIEEIANKKGSANFSDNDRLASLISQFTKARLLLMLSNINGFHTENPENSHKILTEIKSARDFNKIFKGSKSNMGRGGIVSKIDSLKSCAKMNTPSLLCHWQSLVKCQGNLDELLVLKNTSKVYKSGARK